MAYMERPAMLALGGLIAAAGVLMTDQTAPYEVVVTSLTAQPVAAARRRTTIRRVPEDIGGLVSEVWAFLRQRPELRPIHNVAIYWDEHGEGTVECGVQVRGTFAPTDAVVPSATPAGTVAMTAYYGPYHQIGAAHRAVREWCKRNGRERAGPFWEVYGDWNDDPAKLRTDVVYLLK